MRVSPSKNSLMSRDVVTMKFQIIKHFELFGGKSVVKTESNNSIIINKNIEHLIRSIPAKPVESFVLK